MVKGHKNAWYVLYNANDEYIAGFKSIRDLSLFLGHNEDSMSSVMYSTKRVNNEEITKTYNEKEKLYECSQQIFTYINTIKSANGTDLGKNCSLYKFWEEIL